MEPLIKTIQANKYTFIMVSLLLLLVIIGIASS